MTESTLTRPSGLENIRLEDCYQCGKCTAGCPVAMRMDLMPNQVVRLAQIGCYDRAMKATAIWDCVSCQTCSTRCPKSVDCAGVMDALRQMAFEQGATASGRERTLLFLRAFLHNVQRHGRVFELELVGLFKTTGFLHDFNLPLLMKDSLLGPRMMQRGKLHLMPGGVRDRGVVRRIFERCMAAQVASSLDENDKVK